MGWKDQQTYFCPNTGLSIPSLPPISLRDVSSKQRHCRRAYRALDLELNVPLRALRSSKPCHFKG